MFVEIFVFRDSYPIAMLDNINILFFEYFQEGKAVKTTDHDIIDTGYYYQMQGTQFKQALQAINKLTSPEDFKYRNGPDTIIDYWFAHFRELDAILKLPELEQNIKAEELRFRMLADKIIDYFDQVPIKDTDTVHIRYE